MSGATFPAAFSKAWLFFLFFCHGTFPNPWAFSKALLVFSTSWFALHVFFLEPKNRQADHYFETKDYSKQKSKRKSKRQSKGNIFKKSFFTKKTFKTLDFFVEFPFFFKIKKHRGLIDSNQKSMLRGWPPKIAMVYRGHPGTTRRRR